jgi:hypothetical protein
MMKVSTWSANELAAATAIAAIKELFSDIIENVCSEHYSKFTLGSYAKTSVIIRADKNRPEKKCCDCLVVTFDDKSRKGYLFPVELKSSTYHAGQIIKKIEDCLNYFWPRIEQVCYDGAFTDVGCYPSCVATKHTRDQKKFFASNYISFRGKRRTILAMPSTTSIDEVLHKRPR